MFQQSTQFKKMLDKYLKTNKIKKNKFSQSIGVSRFSLYKYETGKLPIPLKVMKAIMYETNSVIDFPEAK